MTSVTAVKPSLDRLEPDKTLNVAINLSVGGDVWGLTQMALFDKSNKMWWLIKSEVMIR